MPTDNYILPHPDLAVRIAPDAVVEDGGRLVIGGAPLRLMRLGERGAAQIAHWQAGAPIGDDPNVRSMAARMLHTGVLLPDPQPDPDQLADQVTVAIPVRGRVNKLFRCLLALVADTPDVPILVVDDGSADAQAIADVAAFHGASVLRLDQPSGVAEARNAALRTLGTPLIAFVDSDVVVDHGWLARLVANFADPHLAAVAPRVVALHNHGSLLTEYEARHSSLDMGPEPSLVGIHRPVPYVPATALVLRRELARDGYDPALRAGEDVDFVWRLARPGWRVLYDPKATVRHDHRVELLPFARRRLSYAWSIGPLAHRHPHALPAMHVQPWSMSGLVLLGLGRRKGVAAAAITMTAQGARTSVRLKRHAQRPTRLAARFTGRTLLSQARGLGHAMRRAWSPVLLPLALRSRRIRYLLLAAVVAALVDERVRPAHVPLKLLDDALAAIATCGSCLEQHTLRPLLPCLLRPHTARPPSTGSAAPVIPPVSGPASHAIADATSSGKSSRSSGC